MQSPCPASGTRRGCRHVPEKEIGVGANANEAIRSELPIRRERSDRLEQLALLVPRAPWPEPGARPGRSCRRRTGRTGPCRSPPCWSDRRSAWLPGRYRKTVRSARIVLAHLVLPLLSCGLSRLHGLPGLPGLPKEGRSHALRRRRDPIQPIIHLKQLVDRADLAPQPSGAQSEAAANSSIRSMPYRLGSTEYTCGWA